MESLSDLEYAVLVAIADQSPEFGAALREQLSKAKVIGRQNTGTGFYTTLAVAGGRPMRGAASPMGDVGADVHGVEHGMGFLLWLRDGIAETLEGYVYDGTMADLDLTALSYGEVGPRWGSSRPEEVGSPAIAFPPALLAIEVLTDRGLRIVVEEPRRMSTPSRRYEMVWEIVVGFLVRGDPFPKGGPTLETLVDVGTGLFQRHPPILDVRRVRLDASPTEATIAQPCTPPTTHATLHS